MRLMMTLGLALTLALATISGAQAADQPRRTISVTAEGAVAVKPDMARISIGVVTRAVTAAEALAANSRRMTQLFEALEAAGVERKDMATSSLSLYPIRKQSKRDSDEGPRIEGFQASNNLSVTSRDLSKLGALLDALARAGANNMGGIGFDVSDREALTDKARRDAVAKARSRAELYADAAGVKLGEVLRIDETGGNFQARHLGEARMAAAAAPAVPIAEGEIRITAGVSIVYALD